MVRGGQPFGAPTTALNITAVEQGNPVSPLTAAYLTMGQNTPSTIWSCYVEDAQPLRVDFEGANGITVLPNDTLAFYFSNFGGDSCIANVDIWFEE